MFNLTDEEFNDLTIDTLAIIPPNIRDDIFRRAIRSNNVKVAEMALELECDPNISFEFDDIFPDSNKFHTYSPTALDVASIQKNPELFKILYKRGGKFNMRHQKFGNRDIMKSLCKDDDFSCLSELISQMPHIDSPFSLVPETLLSSAASIHNLKAIEFLFSHGADINGRLQLEPHLEPDSYYKVYVYNSVLSNLYDSKEAISTIEFLHSLGASIEGIGDDYQYPYEIAARILLLPVILEYFLDKGVDLQKPGRDALLSAAKGSIANVLYLFSIGHKIDVTDSRGETPLDKAIFSRRTDNMKFLLSKGGPFNYEKAIKSLSDSPELLNLIKKS